MFIGIHREKICSKYYCRFILPYTDIHRDEDSVHTHAHSKLVATQDEVITVFSESHKDNIGHCNLMFSH